MDWRRLEPRFQRTSRAGTKRARCCGNLGRLINVKGHLLLAYMLCGFFAGMGGVLLASRLGIAQPSFGGGFELDAIAAVVIGGGILGGGGGGAIGTFWGVLILGVIDNLLNQFNVQSYYQQIIKGLIILAAVLSRRKK